MDLILKNISSLEKIRSLDEAKAASEITSAKVLAGESYSYQLSGVEGRTCLKG